MQLQPPSPIFYAVSPSLWSELHDSTLFDRQRHMGGHSLEIDIGAFRLNVPHDPTNFISKSKQKYCTKFSTNCIWIAPLFTSWLKHTHDLNFLSSRSRSCWCKEHTEEAKYWHRAKIDPPSRVHNHYLLPGWRTKKLPRCNLDHLTSDTSELQ